MSIARHLGDPCIHCGVAHDSVEVGDCPNAAGTSAIVRELEYHKAALARHKHEADVRSQRLNALIADAQTRLNQSAAGLDMGKIALAETILFVGEFSKAGEDREACRQDAIKWFSTQTPLRSRYGDLRREYFGTKSYDRWHGQRSDHEYGYGPRHGHIIFRIGLKDEARRRELTAEECDACIYYLMKLEAIQDARDRSAQ